MRLKVMALPMALLLAACAQNQTKITDTFRAPGIQSKLSSGAAYGGIYTVVFGNPFNADKDELDSLITETMFRAHPGPVVRFLTERPQDSRSPYRVVMLFNPTRAAQIQKLCVNPNQPTEDLGASVRLAAAFCANDIRESSVIGTVSAVDGPQDPAFRQLVRAVTRQLFPRDFDDLRDRGGKKGGVRRRR